MAREPNYGALGCPPLPGGSEFNLLTEAGDNLATEAADPIIQE